MCPYGTSAFRRMPFGLCNAPTTFQRCMVAIFFDLVENIMKLFMNNFSVFGCSFEYCLQNLGVALHICTEKNLVLNWEKCHLMVKEGIVLGHQISSEGLEVDQAKISTIETLVPPTTVRGVGSFLGHAGFYRRFIQDFSKIARLLCKLLKKDAAFMFDEACLEAFKELKARLIATPIIIEPNWTEQFEIMCDASDHAIEVVLG